MGSIRAAEIESTIQRLEGLERADRDRFLGIRRSIFNQGRSDYEMKKAIIYRQNYLKVLERYSNLDNYDLLMEKLNTLNNPLEFYNFVKNDEITVDLTYVSDQIFKEQAFNSFLIRLGFDVEDTITNEYELRLRVEKNENQN